MILVSLGTCSDTYDTDTNGTRYDTRDLQELHFFSRLLSPCLRLCVLHPHTGCSSLFLHLWQVVPGRCHPEMRGKKGQHLTVCEMLCGEFGPATFEAFQKLVKLRNFQNWFPARPKSNTFLEFRTSAF